MIVREHSYVLGKCRWCGAKDLPTLIREATERGETGEVVDDERSCLARDDGFRSLRPEPVRRQFAHEDFEFILARMNEIDRDAKPKCSVTQNVLFNCIHTAARCGDNCPHQALWVGPEEAGAYC